MTRLLSAFLIGIFFATMSSAQDVVGTYRLIAFAVDYDDGTSVDFFGKNPNGYLIIIPKRLVAILAAENRKFGTSVDEKAALLNSLISYSGSYYIKEKQLITNVDISWNQAWTETKQGRTWNIEGTRLTLTTDKAPSLFDPSKLSSGRLVWEKIE